MFLIHHYFPFLWYIFNVNLLVSGYGNKYFCFAYYLMKQQKVLGTINNTMVFIEVFIKNIKVVLINNYNKL